MPASSARRTGLKAEEKPYPRPAAIIGIAAAVPIGTIVGAIIIARPVVGVWPPVVPVAPVVPMPPAATMHLYNVALGRLF